MKIGIPKETKPFENRIALTPQAVKQLVVMGQEVLVEKEAGTGSGFSDKQYTDSGAKIVNKIKVLKAKMIVRVKEPKLETIQSKQILFGYLHVEKGQDPILLKDLKQKKVISFAYHLFFDTKGKRLINLGYEAGVVGIYEGLRLYGSLQKKKNSFTTLPSSWQCKAEEKMVRELQTIPEKEKNLKIFILGNGLVTKGCIRVLNQAGIPYFILPREDTKNISSYLSNADIIVNAVYWKKSEPRIITKELLSLIKPSTPIIDISCDENGSIQTSRPTAWNNPTFIVDGITHFAVDNLPSAIAQDASTHLSAMILPFIMQVARGELTDNGLVTKDGKYVYNGLTN